MPSFSTSNARPAVSRPAPPPAGPPVNGTAGGGTVPNPQPGGPACSQLSQVPVTNPGDQPVTLYGNLKNTAAAAVIWDSVTLHPDDATRWSMNATELTGTTPPGGTVQLSITFHPPAK